ncbi:MAG: type II toxin-antitoxin system RelE/ParE family toxin [Acidimicrobiaceae bacterium]|nr:type II toxin-antitoxin system RelE/ParE family toxin [Acidimicrobiaceae bacterium]
MEFLTGALVESPRIVGHPLRRDLAGLWAARRGPYRVVYGIDEDGKVVSVLGVDHRAGVSEVDLQAELAEQFSHPARAVGGLEGDWGPSS